MKKVYCNLAKILKDKKISIYRLSRDTGVAEATIFKYRDNKNISFDKEVIVKLCNALKIELADLVKSK